MYLSGYWEVSQLQRLHVCPALPCNMTPAQYYRYITQRYDSQENVDVYREQQMLSASAGLSLAQNFDLLGGTFYVDTQLDYMRNFGDSKSTQFSTVPFRIGYQQDLLGYNAFRWDRKIEPLNLRKSRRSICIMLRVCRKKLLLISLILPWHRRTINWPWITWLRRIRCMHRRTAPEDCCDLPADLLTLKLDKVNARNTLRNC